MKLRFEFLTNHFYKRLVASEENVRTNLVFKNESKMKFFFILILSLIIMSCVARKCILRPYVKLEIYDSTTKLPLEKVSLFIKDVRDSIPKSLSDEKGFIIMPKSVMILYTGAACGIRFGSIKYILKKDGYKDLELDLHNHFNIKSKKDYKKKHKSKLFMDKITVK